MITADEIATELCRICPLDAGTPENFKSPRWEEANRVAAEHIVRLLPRWRGKLGSSKGGRSELAWRVVKEGRRIRNEYLAKPS